MSNDPNESAGDALRRALSVEAQQVMPSGDGLTKIQRRVAARDARWRWMRPALAGSVGPSHAWVHAENFGGEVRVAGMTVRSDDLIHADSHGAIVIPIDIAAKLPEAAELCGRRETPILEIARSSSFTLEKLKAALAKSAEIH